MAKQNKKVGKGIYWTPRILSIIFILFLAMFSLDVFSMDLSFGQIMLGLLMHNIPVIILIIILVFAWKYELVGGVAFILAGLAYIVLTLRTAFINGFEWFYLSWILQISGIAFIIGALWLVNWYKKKKN